MFGIFRYELGPIITVKEVTVSCMKAVWQNLLPECTYNFGGFINPVNKVLSKIRTIGRDIDFDDMDFQKLFGIKILKSNIKNMK